MCTIELLDLVGPQIYLPEPHCCYIPNTCGQQFSALAISGLSTPASFYIQTYHAPSEVVDQEKCQNKALNCTMQQTHIRAMADADLCHVKWNCIKNTLNAVGLDMAALKLTITCSLTALVPFDWTCSCKFCASSVQRSAESNYWRSPAGNRRHGSYCSRDHLLTRQQCLEQFLFVQGEGFYEQLAADMAWDQDMDQLDFGSVEFNAHDFLTEDCVRKRGEFVGTLTNGLFQICA